MSNIEFDVLVGDRQLYNEWGLAFSIDPVCEATINHFTGISTVRDSLRLRCNVTTFQSLDAFMMTRFFRTLKELHGFRKITVTIHWIFRCYCDDEILEHQKAVRKLAWKLEPHLGPCTIIIIDSELEFHPLKFYVEKLPAEAARLTEGANKLKE